MIQLKQKLFLLFCITIGLKNIQAQSYFQQHLNYKINVELDDKKHTLKGNISIDYTNNSNDTLIYIFMHLYPNAYKNDRTSFSKQMALLNKTDFYYSDANEKGNIKNLNFSIDGQTVNTIEYNNWADVVMLELNKPLLPKQTINITTPFTVKIPKVFSRLGHEGQNYNISQWYPKPAVYDNTGWHPMPYLEQGEFYSEFGDYEINLTLPDNYYIASTGEIQNIEEIKRIQERILETKDSKRIYSDTVASSSNKKTITLIQKNVHDFAWFASKTFLIEQDSVKIEGRPVYSYCFYQPQNKEYWKNQTKVINYTIEQLSKIVGTYPYNHAIAVDGGLKAGSGMEYPCVTVIGNLPDKKILKTVIIHEIGHNWFYGILANNERDNPFLDESLNSFYENKIDNSCYFLKDSFVTIPSKDTSNILNFTTNSLYNSASKRHELQAGNLASAEYTETNYGGIVYGKNALSLNVLEKHLGQFTFEKCMKEFYNNRNLKHTSINDLKISFEKTSGKDLKWFFEDLLSSDEIIDFKLKNVAYKNEKTIITIKNNSNIPLPVNIIAYNDKMNTGKIHSTKVFLESTTIELDSTFKKIKLSSELDINEKNNFYYKNRLMHKTKLVVKPFKSSIEAHKLTLVPAIGYNNYDKFMLGATLTNYNTTRSKLAFLLAPMYSFGAQNIVGTGIVNYEIFSKNFVHRIELGVLGGRFSIANSNLNISATIETYKDKITPYVQLNFRNQNPLSKIKSTLRISNYNIKEQEFKFVKLNTDTFFTPTVTEGKWNNITTIEFEKKNQRTFNPYSYKIYSQLNKNWTKFCAEGNIKMDYYQKGKSLQLRAFAGKFLSLNNAVSSNRYFLNSTYSNSNDYLYDNYIGGRSEQTGTWAQQVQIQEGGFKTSTPFLASPLGRSDNWLLALNANSDLPIKLRLPVTIKVYADFSTYNDAQKLNPSGSKGLFNTGFSFNTPIGNLYIPVYYSNDFKTYFESTFSKKQRFWKTISFSLSQDIFSRKIVNARLF